MAELTGGSGRVDLGRGYSITVPGMRGSAALREGAADNRSRSTDAETELLGEALAREGMAQIATVDLVTAPVPGDRSGGALRDTRGDDALLLEVPDLGPEAGQVVLMVDEAGALSWHFPDDVDAPAAPADRGAGSKKQFLIPNRIPPAPPPESQGDRSLVGAIGRKLLKVIVYPISDAIVGKTVDWIAEHWESRNRAYGLRTFSPANYQQSTREPADRAALALTSADVAALAEGPALFFVHGTFSTANSAFGQIPAALMTELHQRYGGRVFAFDHFSLSHNPARNVMELQTALAALAGGKKLKVDVVCHSRGGLVARSLAAVPEIEVRRIVFCGVPNKGTLLAHPDHMIQMIDRLSTVLNLLPAGGVTDFLDGLLIGVKIVGHGALKGLGGLASMNPAGPFLKKLNAATEHPVEYFAIAANYEPQDPGLRTLIASGVNAAVDRIFEKAENDLVVPEAGVYEKNGGFGFPVPPERCLRLPASAGVMHTSMFGHPDVVAKLKEWLRADA